MSKLPEPQAEATLPAPQDAQAVAASPLDEAPNAREADRTVVGTVLEVEREFIWIETESTRAKLYASELMLGIGEVPADLYAPGDHFEAFVFQMEPDPNSGAPQFSIRRAAPYLDALNRFKIGSIVVNATVVNTYDVGIELDVGGVRGNALYQELPLAYDESPHNRYQAGDTVADLFILQVNHNTRGLYLSVRRNAPGYVEALNAHSVGDIVSGVVTEIDDGELTLDIDGVIGYVAPDELVLNDGEALGDRYAVGDVVENLLIWVVDHDTRDLALSVRRNAPGYVEALDAHNAGDVVSATVAALAVDGGLWLDVGSVIGVVGSSELSLANGEPAQDRYAVGDTVHDLFVRHVNHNVRHLALSVRRNAPGYPEALSAHSVGDVVSATVTAFQGNGGLWLDVGGVVGSVAPWDLSLTAGKSAQDRYAVGDTAHDLFVLGVDHNERQLLLSIQRNAPGYVEALNAHSVGNVVSGVVTEVVDGALLLDVGGVIAIMPPFDLSLANDESAKDHYTVGDTVDDLFVWQVNRGTRILALSARRNAPGYVDALSAHSVGDVVSATVTAFSADGGLRLDVGGVIGSVAPWDLSLADDVSTQDHYAVGDIVDDLFVWQINRDSRSLNLSVRRNAPGYVEALAGISVGESLDGIVTEVYEEGLWLDAAGVFGWIPAEEMQFNERESLPARYSSGDSARVSVWQIDQASRTLILSVRRLDPDFSEETIELGATIDSVVREVHHGAIRVLVASQSIRILMCELSLGIGEQPHFDQGQGIRVVVRALDNDGKPSALSHRRALPEWQAAVDRLAPGVVVPDAQVVPKSAVPEDEDRAVVDLGPVNGFVRHDELDAKQAEELMVDAPNTQYPVVVDEINEANVIVSRARFEERWQELAEKIAEGDLVDAEFRRASRDSAIVDLGFGLLAEMPLEQLPTINDAGTQRPVHEGDVFPVRIIQKSADALRITVEHREQPIVRLINQGESERLEFKATLRRSPRTGEKDAGATFGVMKSIVGFLNTWDGGTLLVGIDDDGVPITGPNDELGTLAIDRYANEDEMTRALKDLIRRRIGASIFKWLTISFTDFRNTRILRVDCGPADEEVWLKGGKNGTSNQEEFFLRTPAATDPLDGRELVNYIQRRFPGSPVEDD